MKFGKLAFPALVALTTLTAAFCPKPMPADKDGALLQTLLGALANLHFSPQMLNDEYSVKVYDLYLDRLDNGRRFLTQQDVTKLEKYKTELDDQIKANNFEFFDLSNTLTAAGITKAEGYFTSELEKIKDLNSSEEFKVDREKDEFVKSDAELRAHWGKMLRYNILTKVAAEIKKRDHPEDYVKDEDEETTGDLEKKKDEPSTAEPKTDEQIFIDAKEEVRKEFGNWFKRLAKVNRNDRMNIYLNSIANVFDPHTEYFEPVEKQNFDIGMSGRLEGIGARLQTTPDGESTRVSEIITGGPAWKQKELEADDIILKVKQETGEPVDIAGMEIDEVVSKIRGPKGTKVTLTIRKKADNSVKDIMILRDEVIIDEGYAKSLILDDTKNGNKVGYVYLPRFYADFDKADGHFCSTDIEIELKKLQKQNVAGIIIDLRNNGGGSLRDVVKMSGFFIESGPIVQVKSRGASPEVLSDDDSSVQYGGPLIIMVNEFSASASEIMAAALQDYGRAVIVGSRTYGKGTVQRFFDLDRAYRGEADVRPLGQVKVTVQKFFRVDGGSTQLNGVTPDILLPDNYTLVEIGERETEHPLPFTRIDPVKYSQKVAGVKDLARLRSASEARTSKSEAFGVISENAKRIKETREEQIVNLNIKKYLAEEEKDRLFNKRFKDAMKPLGSFSASNLPDDIAGINADESKKARNDEWLKDMKKDPYISETLSIMNDLIKN